MVMNQAIERRALITLDGDGVLLRGTFHRPRGSDSEPGASTRNRIGVVFLNSLSLPRAATGDSAVYWAESFADCGYPSFRLDLPGLGDTAGDIPLELLSFINAGGYASIAAAKMEEMVKRFELSGVVIVGHCAGTVSAIYAAAAGAGNCKGLVLLDPYFHVPQAVRSKVRQGLSSWALDSKIGGALSNIYDRVRDVLLLLRRNAPPGNANFGLLGRWKEVASAGLPILFIKAPARKAPGAKPRVGEFDYLKYVLGLAGRNSKVVVELIQGTDHSFANRQGRLAVRQHTERWLASYFPLQEEATPTFLRSETDIRRNEPDARKNYNGYHLDCLHQ
jgi:pimeloyl-ACP methyl ester carboxylesterase